MYRYYCADCNQEKLPAHLSICLILGHYVVRYMLQKIVIRGKNAIRYIPV